MKADLEQLEEMQKDLFRQQCDLDIQKAMLKHFIKKKEDEQLTLTYVGKSVVCGNCDGWGYTIDDVGSKTCDCQKENSSN